MSSSLTLIASSIPISQGAEAKVYKAYLTPTPTPDSSTSTPTHTSTNGIGHSITTPTLTPTPTPTPILLKHRFQKQYRHPYLDASLTRSRVAGEARALIKCLRSGVNVPGIRMVDAQEGVLGIEWIEGQSVRMLLPGGVDEDEEDGGDEGVDVGEDEGDEGEEEEDRLKPYGISLDTLMRLIGEEIAKMHMADIIHGDLTTSNMMLRLPSSTASETTTSASATSPDPASGSSGSGSGAQTGTQTRTQTGTGTQLVLIDFGLSYHSNLIEDKAVDLYVLERAFSSTHPEPSTRPESESEGMFEGVLRGYADMCVRAYGKNGGNGGNREKSGRENGKENGKGREVWEGVRGRLEDVRLRGRKRSMVG